MTMAVPHYPRVNDGSRMIVGNGASLFLAGLVLVVPITTFLFGAPFAVACGLIMAMAVAARFTVAVPVVLITSFFFQNTMIALLSPAVQSLDQFDMVRAMNFVVLSGCLVVVAALTWDAYQLADRRLRNWFRFTIAATAVVFVYFLLGLAAGHARDVLVYLRNVMTPVACLHIGLLIGATYRSDLRPALIAILLVAVGFGYLEFAFGLDWLKVVNGDHYVRLKLLDAINSGVFEDRLKQTGYVVTGIDEMISRPFLNFSGANENAWKIVRIGGPNFHPISFAYGVAVIALYLAMKRIWWPLIIALPLLVLIGGKGALVLVVFALIGAVSVRIFSPGLVLGCFLTGLVAYVAATYLHGLRVADYHVLGLRSGIRAFFYNPLGAGLGQSGNISEGIGNLDWSRFQSQGITDVPVESSTGVLLHQMGIGALVYLALILAVAKAGWRRFRTGTNPNLIIGMIIPAMLIANGFFQEEAFFAPLALGMAMLFMGLETGSGNQIQLNSRKRTNVADR